MNLRPDAELGERGDRLFHRQADHVCVRAVDFCDDCRAAPLCGVGAGFIQRIHFREVMLDSCNAQAAKTDTRKFMNRCSSSGREMIDENRGANFVRSSTQEPQHLRSLAQISRFTDDFVLQRDERVGC